MKVKRRKKRFFLSEGGVMVARVNPIHLGHTALIGEMLSQYGLDKSLLVIGSSNASFSLRHFFSYTERRVFVRKIFPKLRIVGLPDYADDQNWFQALDDILVAAGLNPEKVVFFGGCEEDVDFFVKAGRKVYILNRYSGITPKISATEVRDALIHGRPLEGMLHQEVAQDIKNLFDVKWEKFKKI